MPPVSRRTLLMIAAAVLVAGGLAWMLRPQPAPVETATVARGPQEVWVEDLGRTRVREVYVVSSPLAGQTERALLHAGDPVKAGQAVVLIRPAASPLIDTRSRKELVAAAAGADAAVSLARAEQQRARAELTFAEGQWTRGQTLARSGVMAPQLLDQRRLSRDTAAAAVASANAALLVRERERDSAHSRLADPAAGEGRCCETVRAPVSGRILRILRESAQVVQAGTPVLEIGDPADMDVVVELLSSDAVQVNVGSLATIRDWGGAPLAARVSRIEPAGFTKVSALGIEEQRVLVYLDFVRPDQAWGRLGHDYRVTARIVTWSAKSVVLAPASALFRQGEDWMVYRVAAGKARLTKVQVGHRNEDVVEVLGGLTPGDRIVAYPGDRLADGVAVTERR
jgi:HlyD family secretion protein